MERVITGTRGAAHIDEGVLPTTDEIASYRRRGWHVTGRVVSDEELDAAAASCDEFVADHPTADPGGVLQHLFADVDYPAFRALVVKPEIAAIGAALAGVEVIRLWHTQLLYKPPDAPGAPNRVGWHTDDHYWQTCSSHRMLTAWVPLHDVTVEMGTLTVIDRSGSWPRHADVGLSFLDQDLDTAEARFRTGGDVIERVPLVVPRGAVSFHSQFTIHGSGPNRTALPRRALAIHLQDGENRWQRVQRTRDGATLLAEHALDARVRRDKYGLPDYGDPAWCPVLWRAG